MIARAAACAALPFRSLLEEAAVAEVFGTLLVSVVVQRMLPEVDLQLLRDDLRDLRVQALAHLRAAVIQQDRAVGVDVQQRAGLVHVRGGEGDAELHRRERDAALEHGVRGVAGRDGARGARGTSLRASSSSDERAR